MKLILALIFSALILVGCAPDDDDPPETTVPVETTAPVPPHPQDDPAVDPDLALAMRTAYVDHLHARHGFTPTMDEVWVQRFIGDFSACPVVYMGSPLDHTAALRPVEIAGYTIIFGSGQLLYVYVDGSFYTLNEAYDAAHITADDVYAIGKAVDPSFSENSTSDAP